MDGLIHLLIHPWNQQANDSISYRPKISSLCRQNRSGTGDDDSQKHSTMDISGLTNLPTSFSWKPTQSKQNTKKKRYVTSRKGGRETKL